MSVVAFAETYLASAFAGVVVAEVAASVVAVAGMQKVAAVAEWKEQVLQPFSSFSISCVWLLRLR